MNILPDEAVRPTILIVDDTPENITVLGEMLHTQYAIRVATSGSRALISATSHPLPDLILLDVMMPEMSGFEVCRILKKEVSFRDIPIIFITALTEEADEARGFEAGAVDFITKPFKPAILKKRISTHLELKSQKDTLARNNKELQELLAKVNVLSGLLPICMMCKKIRDDKGYWNQLEAYISKHSSALFSHSYCPECGEIEMKKIKAVFG